MKQTERLEVSMLILKRCRDEGRQAAQDGAGADSCPYDDEQDLEKAGWLDGWSKRRREIEAP